MSSAAAAASVVPPKGANHRRTLTQILWVTALVVLLYAMIHAIVLPEDVPADKTSEPIRFFLSEVYYTLSKFPGRFLNFVLHYTQIAVVPLIGWVRDNWHDWFQGIVALVVLSSLLRTNTPLFARWLVAVTCNRLTKGHEFREQIKKQFSLDAHVSPKDGSHTHPVPAKKRDAANVSMHTLAGPDLFEIQMSRPVQESGAAGTRVPYWSKDLSAKFQNDEIKPNHVIYMADVDFHLDMVKLLLGVTNPVLMYTCQPVVAAGSIDGGRFFWLPKLKDSDEAILHVDVTGGADYESPIWAYKDSFVVYECGVQWWVPLSVVLPWVAADSVGGYFFAMVFTIAALVTSPWWFPAKYMHVESHVQQQDELKALVALVPMTVHYGLWAVLANYMLASKSLCKLDPIKFSTNPELKSTEQWAVMDIIGKGMRPKVSFAKVGDTVLSATVDAELLERASHVIADDVATFAATIRAWFKTGLSNPADEPSPVELDRLAALFGNFRRAQLPGMRVLVQRTEAHQLTFDPDPRALQDPPRPVMVAVFSPLVAMAVMVPNSGDAILLHALKVRVLNPQNKNAGKREPSGNLTTLYGRYCSSFAAAIASKDNLPVKMGYDQVLKRAKTANQLRLLEGSLQHPSVGERLDPGKPFVKSEAVKLDGAGRVITCMSQSMKVAYASYVYPLMDYISSFDWYGFRTPEEIAQRVASAVRLATHVVETDFSKFDGHITGVLRHFCDAFVLRACFRGEERDDVLRLYEAHRRGDLDVRLQGPLGGRIMVEGGDAQKSGAMDTSIMNTIRNAFICYLTYCLLTRSPARAWALMNATGVFGGDDGIVGIIPGFSPQAYVAAQQRVCEDFGLVIEAKIVERGKPYTYLSRYWNSWETADHNSCCDIRRALSKLHLTTRRNVAPAVVLRDKVLSVLATDRNTPILGDWARAGAHALGLDPAQRTPGVSDSYWGTFDTSFPNEDPGWFGDVLEENFPQFELPAFAAWCALVQQTPAEGGAALALFESPPCCFQPRDEPNLANVDCYELITPGRAEVGKNQIVAVTGTRVALDAVPAPAPNAAPPPGRRGGRPPRGQAPVARPVVATAPGEPETNRVSWFSGKKRYTRAAPTRNLDAPSWRAPPVPHPLAPDAVEPEVWGHLQANPGVRIPAPEIVSGPLALEIKYQHRLRAAFAHAANAQLAALDAMVQLCAERALRSDWERSRPDSPAAQAQEAAGEHNPIPAPPPIGAAGASEPEQEDDAHSQGTPTPLPSSVVRAASYVRRLLGSRLTLKRQEVLSEQAPVEPRPDPRPERAAYAEGPVRRQLAGPGRAGNDIEMGDSHFDGDFKHELG